MTHGKFGRHYQHLHGAGFFCRVVGYALCLRRSHLPDQGRVYLACWLAISVAARKRGPINSFRL